MKPFNEIFLTKEEKKALSDIRRGKSVNNLEVINTLASDYLFVRIHYDRVCSDERHITRHIANGKYSLTPQYERYRAYRREQIATPIFISVISSVITAVITSIATLLILGK